MSNQPSTKRKAPSTTLAANKRPRTTNQPTTNNENPTSTTNPVPRQSSTNCPATTTRPTPLSPPTPPTGQPVSLRLAGKCPKFLRQLRTPRPDRYLAASNAYDRAERLRSAVAAHAAYCELVALEEAGEKAASTTAGPAASPPAVRACSACERIHPASEFSDAQLAKARARKAVCKGMAGEVEMAPGRCLKWKTVREVAREMVRVVKALEEDDGEGVWFGEDDDDEDDEDEDDDDEDDDDEDDDGDEDDDEDDDLPIKWKASGPLETYVQAEVFAGGRPVPLTPFCKMVLTGQDHGWATMPGLTVIEVRRVEMGEGVSVEKLSSGDALQERLKEMDAELCPHMRIGMGTWAKRVFEGWVATGKYDCHTIFGRVRASFPVLRRDCCQCRTRVEAFCNAPGEEDPAVQMQILVLRNFGTLEHPNDPAWVQQLEYFE